MFLLIAIAVGVIVGFLSGGSLANVVNVRFRALPLLLVALFVQVLIFTPILGTLAIIHDIGPYIYIATMLATVTAMVLNFHVPGMPIVALGAALNTLAIIANGGFMPSPEDALREAGRLELVRQDEADRANGDYMLSNSKIADDGTNLQLLGDVLVIPDGWPLSNVFSIGDVIIGIGGAIVIVRAMHAREVKGEE